MSSSDLHEQPRQADESPERLVSFHWNAVYRLLFHMCGNAHDAEDLAQETFLRALNRRDSFRAGTNMRAWVLRIATNAFFDMRRKRKTARAVPLQDEPPGGQEPRESPVELAETGQAIHAALAQLPEVPRAVFLLRSQQELSFGQIAELLNVTQATARWHMLQARRQLMQSLEGKL